MTVSLAGPPRLPARRPPRQPDSPPAGLRRARARWPAAAGLAVAGILLALDSAGAQSVYSRGGGEAGGAADQQEAAAQAERIVASSLARIGRAESVSLRLRQRVRIGDRVLVGAGRYLQAGQGEEQRFRLETTLSCDTEAFSITEVCDGLFCWTDRREGEEPPTLHRVDVQRVRAQLEKLKAPDPADTAPYLGGLQRNLWWIRQWFQFTSASAAELDGRPVWVVEGTWPSASLPSLLPELAEAAGKPGGLQPEELPDGVPWAVRFTIGRDDLLPRRYEFLAIPGPRPVAAGPVEPIAVVDLLEIELNGPVDTTAFYYQPASEGLIDITDFWVSSLGLMRP